MTDVIYPDCEVNRLRNAHPTREIVHFVYCPYCDPEAKHIVTVDSDEPRKNLMRQSEYTNAKGENVFRFKAHDWEGEDDELSLHVAFTCTDCGKKIMSQFEYAHEDDDHKDYVVRGIQLVDDEELDPDDELEYGSRGKGNEAFAKGVVGTDEEDALDVFHSTFPIAMLENYEITVEEAR